MMWLIMASEKHLLGEDIWPEKLFVNGENALAHINHLREGKDPNRKYWIIPMEVY